MACMVAVSMYKTSPSIDAGSFCISGQSIENPLIITRTFRAGEKHESLVLGLFDEANRKQENNLDGIVIILNDFNLAGDSVWAFMKAFVKQDNMKNAVVLVTDDLFTSSITEYRTKMTTKWNAGDEYSEALTTMLEDMSAVFPLDFQNLSGKDTWVAFLPLSAREVEILVQRICNSVDNYLRSQIDNYLGKSC